MVITPAAAARWIAGAAGALLLVLLTVLVVESPPVREVVRARVAAWASRQIGATVAIGDLGYTVASLSFTLDNVSVVPAAAVAAGEPERKSGGLEQLRVRRARVELTWRDLLRARVTPRRVMVSGLDVLVRARDTAVGLHAVSLNLWTDDERRWTGLIARESASAIRVGAVTRPLTRVDGSFAWDQTNLVINALHASIRTTDVDAHGRISDLLGTTPRIDVTGAWQGGAAEPCALAQADVSVCALVRTATMRGRFAVTGLMATPTLRLDVAADGVGNGAIAPVAFTGAAIVVDGRVEVSRADAALLGGTVSMRDASLDTSSRGAAGEVTWTGIDLRRLATVAGFTMPVASTASGEARFRGKLFAPSTLFVDARTTMTSMPGEVPIVAVLTWRLDRGRWSSSGKGRIGTTAVEGRVAGLFPIEMGRWSRVSVDGTMAVAVADLQQTIRQAQQLGAIDRIPAPASTWQGRATADVTLAGTIGAPLVGLALAVTAARPEDARPFEGLADLSVTTNTVGVHSIRITRGADRVSGAGRWDRRAGAVEGEFSGAASDLAEVGVLVGVASRPVRGAATFEGRLSGTASQPQFTGVIRATDVSVTLPDDGIGTVDRTLAFGGVDVTIGMADRIDVRMEAPEAHLVVTSTVGRTPQWPFVLRIKAKDWDAGVVTTALAGQPAIAGRVDAEVVATGSARQPSGLEAQVDLTRVEMTVGTIPVSLLRPAYARIGGGRLLGADVEARVGELTVRLARDVTADAWHLAADGVLPMPIDGLPTPPVVAIDALVNDTRIIVRQGSAKSGAMTADLTGQVPVAFLNRWLPATWQASEDEGSLPATAELAVQALSLGPIARRVYPAAGDVDGTLDLIVSATAASLDLASLRADGRIEHGQLVAAGVTLEQHEAAVVTVGDGAASITGWRWTGTGTDVTLSGESILGDGATRFEVAAAGDLDLGVAFKSAADRVGGTAHFDVSASGNAGGVTWTGDVELRDAAWVARERGIALTETDAHLSCQAERCVVTQFSGQVNGGTLSIEGELPLRDFTSGRGVHVTLRGAGLEMPKGTRHDVDADIALMLSDAPQVTGTVTVWPGTVSDSLVSIVSSVLSLRPSGAGDTAPAGGPSRLSQVPIDVRIVTGNDLTFDSHDLQLAASADLRLRGTIGTPQLRGRVGALERGRVFFGGRMWDLEEGTISLGAGAGGSETRVAATVSAKISKYAVRMSVSGPVSQPTLAMTSDPPLGQGDLAELVLTGQISGSATRAGGQQVASMVSGELLSTAGRSVGIDAVRIEQSQSELSTNDLEPVARLTVSKRLTGRSEIVYSQGLSDSDDQAWVLIYRPGWQSLDLRATIRTNGAEAYEMRQELEFGAPQRRTVSTPRPAAPIISRIDIEGLPQEETVAVRRLLKLAPGDGFTTAKWQKDREAVTRYFHDRDRLAVRVRASHTRTDDGAYDLLYRITPGPLTRIEVHGYPLHRKTLAALRDAWSRTVVEDLLAAELTDVVRLELAAHRYDAAEVDTKFRPIDDSGRLAVIEVSKGEPSRHRAIVFAGNTGITDGELRTVVEQRGLEPRCWIEPSALDTPIAAAYRLRGYLAARATTVRTVERGRATLTVTMNEGPLFTVGTVALTGNTALGEERARAALNVAPAAPFTADVVSTALSRLLTAYARAGYLDAAADARTTVVQERGVVDVTIAVNEGPSSTLQDIHVTGRGETSEQLVSRALDVQSGGPVDPVALDEGQQRLYRTGIFRTVDVDLEPVADAPADAEPRPVQATVTLEERPTYRVRYGIQFGPSTIESITTATDTAEPGATFDLQRRNILGHGIVAGVGGVFSANQHRVRGTVSAATLRGRFVSNTFTIEHANQDREWHDGVLHVTDRSLRAVFEQRWRYGVVRRMEFAYGFEIDHRRLALQATAELLPLQANLADLNATVTFDSRDNRFNPRRGAFHSSRVEAGAGAWLSDLPFTRYQVQQYLYRPIGRATFASGARFGTLAANDRGNPTTMLLFFRTGGATSVRGYETDSLTPAYALGAPVGGKVLLVLNEEMRLPVTRRLGVVGFVDAGNTFTGLDTLSFSALKVGAGAGLRLDTPVAVLRLDIALPLPRQPGGPRQRWYLSIGQAF